MGNSTPSPESPVNIEDVEIDYADYLKVADANLAPHKRAVKLIYLELAEELYQNGIFHFKSVAEIADDYGWCRGEVLHAALYMQSRGLIDLRIHKSEKPEPCDCGSCLARETYVSFKFESSSDETEARLAKHEALVGKPKDGGRWWLDGPSDSRGVSGKPGFIYLIKAGDRYKIGVTNNLQRRLSQLNSGQAPFPVEVIHHVHGVGYVAFEGKLHARFDDSRVHGEWFQFSPEDVAAAIETMNEWAASQAVKGGE